MEANLSNINVVVNDDLATAQSEVLTLVKDFLNQ